MLLGLMGCGAAALPPQEPESTDALQGQAVWISDQGDHAAHVQYLDKFNKINILPSDPVAHYVYGAYTVLVPDVPEVVFRAQVEQSRVSSQAAVFQVYTQRGAEFVLLGQVLLDSSHESDQIEVDLSAYRGQDLLLILSVSAPTPDATLSAPVSWDNPQIVHP